MNPEDEFPAPEDLPYVEDVAKDLAPHWAVYLFRGLLVTGFGLFFFCSPDQSVDSLATVFGVMLVMEGSVYLVKACYLGSSPTVLINLEEDPANPSQQPPQQPHQQSVRSIYLGGFLASTVLGIAIVSYPHETVSILLICAASWFLLIGVLQLLTACIFNAAEVRGGSDWIIAIVGFLYVIAGVAFLAHLDGSLRVLVQISGAAITLFGFQLLYLSLRLRQLDLSNTKSRATGQADVYVFAAGNTRQPPQYQPPQPQDLEQPGTSNPI